MRARNGESGFSGAELMVAIAVAALVMMMTIGIVARMVPQWRLRSAALDIASAIQATRARAILDRTQAAMPFDPPRGLYTVQSRSSMVGNGATRIDELPSGIRFVNPGNNGQVITVRPPGTNDPSATFDASGYLKSVNRPGYVYLGNASRNLYRRVRVSAAGTVTIQRWNGADWE